MEAKSKSRMAVALLTLSAAGFVGIVQHEGYTDRAIVPVKGDRPTIGFGSTFRDDGSPVQMGDTITPAKAMARSYSHIRNDEAGLKECVHAPLHQHEYDTLVGAAYQYGTKAMCASSMVRLANAGRYEEACQAYARYRFVAGRDCSIRSNGCYGVYTRAMQRVKDCLGES